MATAAKAVQARAAQRDQAKRATLEALLNKPRAEKEFSVALNGAKSTLLFRALGAREYDALLTKHPPTPEQKESGGAFNIYTFGPALMARACVDPVLDEKEWNAIWTSESWGRGEVMDLFWGAMELTNQGLDISPTAAG